MARLLEAFADSAPGKKYPMIAANGWRHWAEVIPFYDWPSEVRKMIDTTNAIESLNLQLRKVLKNRGHFPSETAGMPPEPSGWRPDPRWGRPGATAQR